MKYTYVLLSLVAAATLTACSSGGSTASLGNSGALISESTNNLPTLSNHQKPKSEQPKGTYVAIVDSNKSDNLNTSNLPTSTQLSAS